MTQPRIGLALGSGSARGWAHIGVIQALKAQGINPQVIAGCSIGALVGGAFAAGYLDELEAWIRTLDRKGMLRFFDLSFTKGGVIIGDRLIHFFRTRFGDMDIEALSVPFCAIATHLNSGREVWFKTGPLLDAVHASFSVPGLFAPVRIDNRWYVDGGMVNPVPVSTCRAMDAEIVIAVKLSEDTLRKPSPEKPETPPEPQVSTDECLPWFNHRFRKGLKDGFESMLSKIWHPSDAPGMFEVMATSILIMQERITRSRMAGDPPDVTITPRVGHLGPLEFYRAEEAIEAGRASVQEAREQLAQLLETWNL
jgi:NTE family protein